MSGSAVGGSATAGTAGTGLGGSSGQAGATEEGGLDAIADSGLDARDASACTCQPGMAYPCGDCGTATCKPDCVTLETCLMQGCHPGTARSCGSCGTQQCAPNCTWGTCLGTVDTQNDPCNCGGCGYFCNPVATSCSSAGSRFACACAKCYDRNNCSACCGNVNCEPCFRTLCGCP
jgi:hypothetical protein